MKDDRLDHIIKDKLKDLQVPYKEAHWDLFAEQLDATQGGPAMPQSEDFDAIIFNKMNDFSATESAKSSHWAALEKELDQFLGLRDQILQFKLVESILISLLLLIVVKWGIPEHPLDYRMPATPTMEQQLQEAPIADLSVEQENSSLAAVTPTPKEGIKSPNSQQLTIAKTSQADLANKQATEKLVENKVLAIADADAPTPKVPTTSELIPAIKQSTAVSTASETIASLANNENSLQEPISTKEASDIEDWTIADIASVTPSLSWSPKPFFFDPTSLPKYRKLEFQISMLGGGEYNQVMTPYDDDKGIKQFNRYSLGYRGGLTFDVGRSNSRLRLGSGLIYTAKQYEAGSIQRIQGSFLSYRGLTAEALENIELNIINIPVFARYSFLNGKRWSVFAQAGVSMQMALQSNYYVGYPTNLPQPTGVGQTPTRISLIGDRKDGLLGGGSFSENSFFTGNMGLGMERTMAERWSLFFQSRYEYSIGYFSKGLGPTHDRINTMSFESGVRVRLK